MAHLIAILASMGNRPRTRTLLAICALALTFGLIGYGVSRQTNRDQLVVFTPHAPGNAIIAGPAHSRMIDMSRKRKRRVPPINFALASKRLKKIGLTLGGSSEVDLTPNNPNVGVPGMPGHFASVFLWNGSYSSLSTGCFAITDSHQDAHSMISVILDVPKANVPYVMQVDFLPLSVPWQLNVIQLSNRQTSTQTLNIAASQGSAEFAYVPAGTALVEFMFQGIGQSPSFFDFKITGF